MILHQARASRARCGIFDCGACNAYLQKLCPGCSSGNRQVLRRKGDACMIYLCVRDQKITGCYECTLTDCEFEGWREVFCPLRRQFGIDTNYNIFFQELKATKGISVRQKDISPLPKRVTERMRSYLQAVEDYLHRNQPTISSLHLARAVGARSSLVRRDLSGLGHVGTQGRGYDVAVLRRALRQRLQLDTSRNTVWLGSPCLIAHGGALQTLNDANCRLIGIYSDDLDSRFAETGLMIKSLSDAPKEIKQRHASVAIIASEEGAQPEVLQSVVTAGISAILNLTPAPLTTSAQVIVEQADLGNRLLRLLARLIPTER